MFFWSFVGKNMNNSIYHNSWWFLGFKEDNAIKTFRVQFPQEALKIPIHYFPNSSQIRQSSPAIGDQYSITILNTPVPDHPSCRPHCSSLAQADSQRHNLGFDSEQGGFSKRPKVAKVGFCEDSFWQFGSHNLDAKHTKDNSRFSGTPLPHSKANTLALSLEMSICAKPAAHTCLRKNVWLIHTFPQKKRKIRAYFLQTCLRERAWRLVGAPHKKFKKVPRKLLTIRAQKFVFFILLVP